VKAEILTIGDELLRGEIVDSNKSFLSDRRCAWTPTCAGTAPSATTPTT
jgi:hypothetical protein